MHEFDRACRSVREQHRGRSWTWSCPAWSSTTWCSACPLRRGPAPRSGPPTRSRARAASPTSPSRWPGSACAPVWPPRSAPTISATVSGTGSPTVEGIDLTLSRKLAGWQTPFTVALAYDNDRALVTRGTPPPLSADELITAPPAARAVAAHIGPWPNEWLAKAKAAGGVVFADVGWDPSEQWDPAGARPAGALRRVPAERRRGDELHPDGHARAGARTTGAPRFRWSSCRTVPTVRWRSTPRPASGSTYRRIQCRRRTPPGRVTCSPPASSPPRCGTCR